MNIDERLEALTQSVGLLASMHRDNEQRLATLSHQTEERFNRTLDIIDRLAGAVESHERRISGLENQG